MRLTLALVAAVLIAAAPTLAQDDGQFEPLDAPLAYRPDAPVDLPDTPAGQLVAEFMTALAGDAAAHQAFIEARFTPDMLAFAEMDQHLAMFAQLAADFGGQDVLGLDAGAHHVRFTVHAPAMGDVIPIQFDTTGDDALQIAGLQIG